MLKITNHTLFASYLKYIGFEFQKNALIITVIKDHKVAPFKPKI